MTSDKDSQPPWDVRLQEALSRKTIMPEADIYKNVGKQSWPYDDRPKPRKPNPPDAGGTPVSPTSSPNPLAPSSAEAIPDE